MHRVLSPSPEGSSPSPLHPSLESLRKDSSPSPLKYGLEYTVGLEYYITGYDTVWTALLALSFDKSVVQLNAIVPC